MKTAAPPGPALTVVLALGFVGVSLLTRIVPWEALAFLGDRSISRNLLTSALALGLTTAAAHWANKRWPHGTQLQTTPKLDRSALRTAALATLVGALMFALVAGIAAATGGLRVSWNHPGGGALVGFLLAAVVGTLLGAAWEEITFRGWPFALLKRIVGPHGIALGIGALFGVAHMLNPNWTPAGIASVGVAGWLLGYTMLATGNILAPIGLHTGWNLMQTLLTSRTLWSRTASDNAWLSGGQFGLEASAAGIAVTAAATAGAIWLFNRRTAKQ